MYSISTRNLQSLHSFGAAENYWNNTKAWRKEDPSWRPLDSPRMPHKRLVKNRNGGYECTLFRTALVTYYPDRVVLDTHHSVSSNAFMCCMKPEGCQPVSANADRFWQVNTPDGVRFYRGYLELSSQGKGLWKLKNKPELIQEKVYDRQTGAEIRKLLKPYTDWYTMTARLGVKLPDSQYMHRGSSAEGIRTLMAQPDNSTQFLSIAELLGSPKRAIKTAYEQLGAYSYQDVPPDRLPRRSRA